jgi:hypothetical protein
MESHSTKTAFLLQGEKDAPQRETSYNINMEFLPGVFNRDDFISFVVKHSFLLFAVPKASRKATKIW